MNILFSDNRDEPPLSDELDVAELTRIAAGTLAAEEMPASLEVALSLVDESTIAKLNETHLGRTGPTDVLSFPLEALQSGRPPSPAGQGPPLHIGDVFICPRVVANNAAINAVALQDEMALMVIHGLLHLLGYDHLVDAEAEQMEQRERDLLAGFGMVRS